MLQLKFKPELHLFQTCSEFAEAFHLGDGDVVLTNRYIYEPYFRDLGKGAHLIFQENYGQGEPTDVMVDAILDVLKGVTFTRIIAIGGGTILDIAKVLTVAGTETVDGLYGQEEELRAIRDLILVPTTCGTGSEMTNIAILNRTKLETKMGLVSTGMYAKQAVLIPELLSSLPYSVFATSSLDALVHAVESALSPHATPYSKLFSYSAIDLIINGYIKMRDEGAGIRANLLEDFLIASNYAGLAFGTAGCAAVHASAA